MKFLKMSNFTFFHNVFHAICILKSLKSHIQMSSTASMNLGRSQNGVLGNGLRRYFSSKNNFEKESIEFLLCLLYGINPFPNKPWFYVSAEQVFYKHCGKRRNCSERAISPFPTVFSTLSENFSPFSSY